MKKCNICDALIDLDKNAFYPYAEVGDELNPHELSDTPFCEECAEDEKKIILVDKIKTILDTWENDDSTLDNLEKGLSFCGNYDIADGYKHAIRQTLSDQADNHIEDLEVEDLKDLINTLTK